MRLRWLPWLLAGIAIDGVCSAAFGFFHPHAAATVSACIQNAVLHQ